MLAALSGAGDINPVAPVGDGRPCQDIEEPNTDDDNTGQRADIGAARSIVVIDALRERLDARFAPLGVEVSMAGEAYTGSVGLNAVVRDLLGSLSTAVLIIFGMLVVLLLFVLGRFAPSDFLQHLTVFVLAVFVGWQVVWSVTAALHTPLMAVTNAISGITVVGAVAAATSGAPTVANILGALAIVTATINVVGGFMVTDRMLGMFKKKEKGGAK